MRTYRAQFQKPQEVQSKQKSVGQNFVVPLNPLLIALRLNLGFLTLNFARNCLSSPPHAKYARTRFILWTTARSITYTLGARAEKPFTTMDSWPIEGATHERTQQYPVSYTHLTLPTNREV